MKTVGLLRRMTFSDILCDEYSILYLIGLNTVVLEEKKTYAVTPESQWIIQNRQKNLEVPDMSNEGEPCNIKSDGGGVREIDMGRGEHHRWCEAHSLLSRHSLARHVW